MEKDGNNALVLGGPPWWQEFGKEQVLAQQIQWSKRPNMRAGNHFRLDLVPFPAIQPSTSPYTCELPGWSAIHRVSRREFITAEGRADMAQLSMQMTNVQDYWIVFQWMPDSSQENSSNAQRQPSPSPRGHYKQHFAMGPLSFRNPGYATTRSYQCPNVRSRKLPRMSLATITWKSTLGIQLSNSQSISK